MAKVTVIIDPKTAQREYIVEGMVGTTCEDLTRLITQNQDVVEEQYTEEYYKQEELPEYVDEFAQGEEYE